MSEITFDNIEAGKLYASERRTLNYVLNKLTHRPGTTYEIVDTGGRMVVKDDGLLYGALGDITTAQWSAISAGAKASLATGAQATVNGSPVVWRGESAGGWGDNNSVGKLKAHLLAQSIVLPDVMATPPTISTGAAYANPAVATVRIIPWNGVAPQTNTVFNSQFLRIFNQAKVSGSALYSVDVTTSSQEKFKCSTPVFTTANGNIGGMCISFVFDGSDFEILSYGGMSFFGTANGKAISANKVTSHTGTTPAWTRFAFGSREIRNIHLYLNGIIGCIAIGSNDTIFPLRTNTPSAVIHGDSFFTTTSNYLPFGGLGGHAALLAGIKDVWGTGWGGAGYVATSGPAGNASTAFPELANVESCDLWHCSLGINEDRAAVGPEVFDSAVYQYYSRVREAFPQAVISATGPWCPKESRSLGPRGIVMTDAIRTQIERIPGPWIFLDNTRGTWSNSSGMSGSQKVASTSSVTAVNGGPSVNTGAQSPVQSGAWQTGEGYIGATTGKGNGDLNTSADGTHPSPPGVAYLGYKIADGWKEAILAL